MAVTQWITPFLRQSWCVSSILISITFHGFNLGFMTTLLPALRDANSTIQIDLSSGTWLASVSGPSVFIGTLWSCFLMDWCGRRYAGLLASLPGILGWLLIYLAQSYAMLLIGRILISITAGAVHNVGLAAIGEFTSPQYRPMFLNLKATMFSLGSAIVHIMGNYMHWKNIAVSVLLPLIISFLITCTWPESPAWLASRKQFDRCERDFFWLRGISDESIREVTELIKAQKERLSKQKRKVTVGGKISEVLHKFTKADFIKPIGIISVGFLLMESCGRHIFPTYALQIVGDALNTTELPYFYTLIIDLIITLSSFLSSLLVRMLKQRTVLFTTGFATLLILIVMSIYLVLVSEDVISRGSPWIIICLLISHFSLTNLGIGPIPFSLQGELIPLAHKEVGFAVLGFIISVLLMFALKVFPYMLLSLKIYGTFAAFSVVMGTTLSILYFTLPETKGRTLQDIENYFNHGRFTIDEIKGDDDNVHLKMINDEKE